MDMEQMMERKNLTMCIKHSDIEVKELSELLYIINLSINDYYRDNGIANGQLNHYAPTIQKVQQGSIILDLAIALLENIAEGGAKDFVIDVAKGVAVELIAKYLWNRIRLLRERYEKGQRKRRQIFDYEITTRIEISIQNSRLVIEVKKKHQ